MHELRARIAEILSGAKHLQSPEAEVDQILFHVLRKEDPTIQSLSDLRMKLASNTVSIAGPTSGEALRIAADRANGAILQHLLGHQFFYEHEYAVSEAVLVPRPETEILISAVIEYCKKTFGDRPFRFAELGLGSGILSCEILSHFPRAHGVASEASPAAVKIAKQNLNSVVHSWTSRLHLIEPTSAHMAFEVFAANPTDSGYDLIVSNPPYVSSEDSIEEQVLKHEPHQALFPLSAGHTENPNYFYESFLSQHDRILKPNGIAFFEIPHERADVLIEKFKRAGFEDVNLIQDLTGRARVLVSRKV